MAIRDVTGLLPPKEEVLVILFFIKDETPYKASWPCYKVFKVHFKTASYEHAEKTSEQLINSVQSDSSLMSVTSNRSLVKKIASKLDISSSSCESPSPTGTKSSTKTKHVAQMYQKQKSIAENNKSGSVTNKSDTPVTFSDDSEIRETTQKRKCIPCDSSDDDEPLISKRGTYNVQEVLSYKKTPYERDTNRNTADFTPTSSGSLLSATSCSLSTEKSLDEVARHLSDIKNTLVQHSVMLNALQNQVQLTNVGSLVPPPGLPDFPMKTFESFKEFEKMLEESEAIRTYMTHRLAAIGGSGLDALVRRILKFVMSNDVAILFNWKGREKHAFESTKIMNIIYTAAKVNFPKNERNDQLIENTVKEWLKYAKARMNRTRENTKV